MEIGPGEDSGKEQPTKPADPTPPPADAGAEARKGDADSTPGGEAAPPGGGTAPPGSGSAAKPVFGGSGGFAAAAGMTGSKVLPPRGTTADAAFAALARVSGSGATAGPASPVVPGGSGSLGGSARVEPPRFGPGGELLGPDTENAAAPAPESPKSVLDTPHFRPPSTSGVSAAASVASDADGDETAEKKPERPERPPPSGAGRSAAGASSAGAAAGAGVGGGKRPGNSNGPNGNGANGNGASGGNGRIYQPKEEPPPPPPRPLNEELLQREYFQLHQTVEDFDKRSMILKAWSVTLALGGVAAAYIMGMPLLMLLSALGALAFWTIEVLWKSFQNAFYHRMVEIEDYYNGQVETVTSPFIYRSWHQNFATMPRRVLMRIVRWPHVFLPHAPVAVIACLLFAAEMVRA